MTRDITASKTTPTAATTSSVSEFSSSCTQLSKTRQSPKRDAKYPTKQYLSDDFVISAGAVLFRRSDEGKVQVCLIYRRDTSEWLLPKGRKDANEAIGIAAARETFEETGMITSIVEF